MKEELRIRYNIKDGIDPELDAAVIELASQHGWRCWASGLAIDPFTGRFGERDLAFDREEVAEPVGIGCKPSAGSLESLTYYCGED